MPVLQATRPSECWTWDITKLPGPEKRVSYFLSSIIDIYSRKIVDWTVADRESELIARVLIERTTEREGIKPETLTLHSDRGSAMISGTVAELLSELAVTKSHSRPRVSNDNPFSEANFKTLNYRPDYPKRFQSIQHARTWAKESSSTGTTSSITTAVPVSCTPLTCMLAGTNRSLRSGRQRWTPPTGATPKDSTANQEPAGHRRKPG